MENFEATQSLVEKTSMAELFRRNAELGLALMERIHVDKTGGKTPVLPEDIRTEASNLIRQSLSKLQELVK